MPKYNVLTEPWIPIEDMQGQAGQVGILDALKEAHKIRCVKAASPLVSYGIQRTLIAFLIDAFRPKDIDELADLIAKNEFDSTALEQYVSLCNANGECFDLFDTKHPFMQSAIDEDVDKEKETSFLTRLFVELPEGNNHTHFQHKLEEDYLFTPAECAQILCTVPSFATNIGTNAFFSINGMPPLYFLYNGSNLFKTLSGSMIAQTEHSELPLDSPPIVWRNTIKIEKGGLVAKTSLLYGLTCQPRRITLIPIELNDNVLVKEMYYAKGYNFKELPNWKDPHVAYYEGIDKKTKTIKAQEGRGVWRDLGRVIHSKYPPKFLNKIRDKLNIDSDSYALIGFNTCGLIGDFKGPVYAANSWIEEGISFDIRITENEEKGKLFDEVLSLAEEVNKILGRTIKQSVKQLSDVQNSSKKEKGRYENLTDQAQEIFFSKAKVFILGDFCNALANTDASKVDWDINIKKQIGEKLKDFAQYAFYSICDCLDTSAKTLKWRAISERVFNARINKRMKGE